MSFDKKNVNKSNLKINKKKYYRYRGALGVHPFTLWNKADSFDLKTEEWSTTPTDLAPYTYMFHRFLFKLDVIYKFD